MTYKEIKKDTYIINVAIPEATPWYVINKLSGMVLIRRRPKVGKLVALMPGQLKAFKSYDRNPAKT